jgi:hypothetical protein
MHISNVFSIVSALSKHIPDLAGYSEEWIKCLVCENATEACFFNECTECKDARKLRQMPLPENAEDVMVEVPLWNKCRNAILDIDQFVKSKVAYSVESLFHVSLFLLIRQMYAIYIYMCTYIYI